MKRISVLAVVIGLAALGARAQTNVTTAGGTPGRISKFTGSTMIGDSQIQEIDSNIGINTDFIVGRLSVFESRENGIQFPQPYAVYGNVLSDMNFAAGVRGDASATSGNAAGVIGVSYSPDGKGMIGLAAASTGGGVGVAGSTNSPDGFGVNGFMGSSTGQGVGVVGTTLSDEGIGVIGNRVNSIASGFGGGGVRGLTSAANFVFTYGAAGVATANTGSAVGIFGQTFSPNGTAGLFANVAGGNIILGGVGQPEVTVFRVDGRGTIFADGGFRPFGADFAESLAVKGSREHYAPGDLLVIDSSAERRLSVAETPYSTLVAGIYSTQPGVVASQHRVAEALPYNEVPLAVVGIVPCKVTAENGPIAVGDLLVTSSTPGHAMKGTDRSKMLGAVVGKALESLNEGKGVIQVLVTLQ